MRFTFILFYLLFVTPLFAQNKEDIKSTFKKDISYLASDALEGRLTGSDGELKSSMYIADEFKKLNLTPKGDNGTFLQNFSIIRLRINQNQEPLMIKTTQNIIFGLNPAKGEFYPLSYSCNQDSLNFHPVVNVGYGIVAPELNQNDYSDSLNIKGKIFIIRLGSPESNVPHSKYSPYEGLAYKVNTAIKYGARGVIFIRTDTFTQHPSGQLDRNIKSTNIPVLYAKLYQEFFLDGELVTFKVKIAQLNAEAHNVIGFINNKKAKTIVIGAHQDHLGYNEYGGSREPNSGKIHNGADDNASGVAMMMQLMRKIKKTRKFKKANYLFIAFSGEEQGLLGSNYFVNHPTIDLKSIKYMLNFDMVGRLDSNKKTLMIYGVGTSPDWKKGLDKSKTDTTILKVKTSESGTGSSDHTSFYYNKIPVLHYFTGQHSDYHKPSDDEHLINYEGMYLCYNHVLTLMNAVNKTKDFTFTPTKAEATGRMSFKVKLGIMPDYAFDGPGVKADGVNMGGVAEKAGLLKNDIITKLGNYQITTMQDYMTALSSLNPGDKAEVVIKRGNETIILNAQF
ncbi:MAG: M20/M25/M40 family metallo-hydrolase [Bacteroidota bacterium]|nr:M20/M25/M40 family metallo-hydrolase [Bacteroidota bacterium]